MSKPIVWTIAGADCSGGAGISADIRTMHNLGAEGCHIITANTVQNAQGLYAVNPIYVDVIRMQLSTLWADKQPQAIKIGLLVSDAQLLLLIDWLSTVKRANKELMVVFDPVGHASVGGKFATLSADYLQRLCAICDVVTPNLKEARVLCHDADLIIDHQASEMEYARALSQQWQNTVVVKGGHNDEQLVTDVAFLYGERQAFSLTSSRIATSYSHGGGCAFSSALATFLAHGYLLRDAFMLTKAFMQQGLAKHEGKSDYYGPFAIRGWPRKACYFPRVNSKVGDTYHALKPFLSLEAKHDATNVGTGITGKLGLYPVVDSVEWIAQLLICAPAIIQLRLKDKTDQELRTQISRAVQLCQATSTRLFINDYWQLAIEYGAYGVHLGQEDLIDADLEAIQQAGLRLGISTHGCYEFILAHQLSPSYLAIGAVFPTKTKDMTGQIQGVDNLRRVNELANNIPVVAIGGISLSRAPQVWQTGVDGVAVVTAITEAADPITATQEFQQILS